MAESPFSTRVASRQDELLASAQLRQHVRQKAEEGDRALVKDSWRKASHAVVDRYYGNRKREDGSKVPGTARKREASLSRLYRQARQDAKQAKGPAQGGMEMAKKAASSAISAGTSEMLQQSWLNLIDSYGLTLIWINVHVFCRFTIGEEYFCKLGREWLPRGEKGFGSAMQAEGKATGGGTADSILGMPMGGLGLLEAGLLGMLDLIVLCLILISLAPIVFVAYIAVDPVRALFSDLPGVVSLIATALGL